MTEIELLEHVLENRKAGRDAGHGLLYEDEPSIAIVSGQISWQKRKNYSIAPRTHVVNGFTVPAPETEAPERGSLYYVADASEEGWTYNFHWEDDTDDFLSLARGRVFLTEEAARANAMAQLGFNPEGTE